MDATDESKASVCDSLSSRTHCHHFPPLAEGSEGNLRVAGVCEQRFSSMQGRILGGSLGWEDSFPE